MFTNTHQRTYNANNIFSTFKNNPKLACSTLHSLVKPKTGEYKNCRLYFPQFLPAFNLWNLMNKNYFFAA